MYTVPCIGYPKSPGRIIKCNEMKINIVVIKTTLYIYVIIRNKFGRTLFT